MTLDIVLTVLNVVFGLLLTGIGIEMVNNPPDTTRKKWIYRTFFGALGVAVFVTTLIQSTSNTKRQGDERSSYLHDQAEMRERLGTANGKLDAIAGFQSQFIDFVSKHPGGSSDDAVRAMASAVLKMAQPSTPRPSVESTDICLNPSQQQLQLMGNAELKKYAIHIVEALKEFDAEWEWSDRPAMDDQDMIAVNARMFQRRQDDDIRDSQYWSAFQIRFHFLPILRDEIRSRIPGQSRQFKLGQYARDDVKWGKVLASSYCDELAKLAARVP